MGRELPLVHPEDWEFLAEGGAHLVFLCASSRLRVCRVPKRHRLDYHAQQLFGQRVLGELLCDTHLLAASHVCLSEAFVHRLVAEAVAGDGRRAWDASAVRHPWFAEILPNCHSLHVPRQCVEPFPMVSFELKVKGGLPHSSPLIHSSRRRLKLAHSRYSLVQAFKQIIGNDHAPSKYDPRDLCSGRRERVSLALAELLRRPGNNLSVRINGSLVFPTSLARHSSVMCEEVLAACACAPSGQSIVNKLCELLCSEDAAARLERMQSIDLIDVEGASKIMDRLSHLTGNEEQALALVEESMGSFFPFDLCALSMWTSGTWLDTESATRLFGADISALMQLQVSSRNSDEELDLAYDRASALVEAMSAASCVALLRLWQVALAAKDASIVLTLQYSESDDSTGGWRHSTKFVDVTCKPASKALSLMEREVGMCRAIMAANTVPIS